MTDEEIERAVNDGVSGIESEWLERGSSADRAEAEQDMARVRRLGEYAQAMRAEVERLRARNEALREMLARMMEEFEIEVPLGNPTIEAARALVSEQREA